jgi:amicyanin
MSVIAPWKATGRLCAAVLMMAALGFPGSAGGKEQASTASVRIDNFTFTPAEITIAAGSTLTWTNGDDIPHTVTATGMAFRSKALDTGDQYSFTFTAPGTYDYFCALHPHMQGKVIVK